MNSIPNPSFDWNNEDRLDELKTFKRTCKYLLAGPYLKLSEHEKSMFVLIWLGKQGQKLHEELVENTGDKKPLDILWTFLETQLTPAKQLVKTHSMPSNTLLQRQSTRARQ